MDAVESCTPEKRRVPKLCRENTSLTACTREGGENIVRSVNQPQRSVKRRHLTERNKMLRTVLLVVLILVLLGSLPTWPYSTGWGYYPSGGLGLVLLIVVILIVAKKI